MITAGLLKCFGMESKVASCFLLHLKLPKLFQSKIFPNVKEFFHFSAVCLSLLSLGCFLASKYKRTSKIRKKPKHKNIKTILMILENIFDVIMNKMWCSSVTAICPNYERLTVRTKTYKRTHGLKCPALAKFQTLIYVAHAI